MAVSRRGTGRRWHRGASGRAGRYRGAARAQAARQDRQDRLPGTCRTLLAEGRLPECWIPPAQILEYRAQLELYHDLRAEHTAQAQLSRCSSTRALPALGEGALGTGQGLAALRGGCGRAPVPAGQLQVATALDMLAALETRMDVLRKQLRAAARQLTGAKVLAERLYGVGPVTALALTCWLGGEGRFSSSRQGGPVHRAGHHRLVFGP